MERYIIALQYLGIKNNTLIRLVTQYSSDEIELIFKDTEQSIFLKNIEFSKESSIYDDKSNLTMALEFSENVLNRNDELNIKIAIFGDEKYPENLSKIEDPPVLIYYKGANIGNKFNKSISCVGTRKPTNLSYNIINYLIPQLVQEDFSIISGLALGSDRMAHISCLMSGGKTIAVLAHGLDLISPKKNMRLAEDIIKNGGTLVSEYPVGSTPENYKYVNRNRLIVGMSKGVIVGECGIKSGTMHSVDFAKEQKKPIFCTNPGEILNEEQEGIKYLLEQKTAIEIQNGRAYDVPILETGYKCKKKLLTVDYINKVYIKSLLYNMWDNQKIYKTAVISISQKSDQENLWEDTKYSQWICNTDLKTSDILKYLLQVCLENKISD